MKRLFVQLMILLIFAVGISGQTVKIADHYQPNGGNRWNYTAPPSWNGDNVSVMEKASARFIIINAEGKEIINRLVETDLKSYQLKNQCDERSIFAKPSG